MPGSLPASGLELGTGSNSGSGVPSGLGQEAEQPAGSHSAGFGAPAPIQQIVTTEMYNYPHLQHERRLLTMLLSVYTIVTMGPVTNTLRSGPTSVL